MRQETGKIKGQTVLSDDLRLHGMWVGDCEVVKGGHLRLHGMVTGNLTVHHGATASVFGMVNGDLLADGETDVHGMIGGHAAGPGLDLKPGAVVRGDG